jgi:glycosyltransferase involved in cell wall biosynthesis
VVQRAISEQIEKEGTAMKILFLGETYRADAQTWIKGIEEASGCKIDTDEIKTIRFKPIRAIQAFLFIGRLLWGRFFGPKYDIVLAERSTSYGFFSLFTNAKIKVVAQQGISDIYPNTFFSRGYKKILQRLVYKNVDVIHAWGNAMVPAMLKSGADPKTIVVLPKGIDLKKYYFTDHFSHNKPFELRAIVTRALASDYNHYIIIQAVAELKKKGVKLDVDIVGDGPLKGYLISLSKELKVDDRVHFLGRIPNEELPNYLAKCPLYISTPITEGASSSLMEAMASGCFPIVTDLPGNKSFIKNGINGLLVDKNSVASLEEALEYAAIKTEILSNAAVMNMEYAFKNLDRGSNMRLFFKHYLNCLANTVKN